MSKILNFHIPAEQKNLIINGALDFWQQNVGNTITVNTATTQFAYSCDMFKYFSSGSTVKNYSLVRSTDVPTVAQSGFQAPYSKLFTMLTGISSFAAADIVYPNLYQMEGQDYAQIHGQTVTYGIWMKASVAGVYSVSFQNATNARSYVTTVTVNLANTWEYKQVTLTMDTTGTWAFDNTAGLLIVVGACTGSNNQTSTLNSWQAGNFLMATTATNYMGTTNATLRVGMISLVEGSMGFGPLGFQRSGKSIPQEQLNCQRYYSKSYNIDVAPNTSTFGGLAWGLAVDTNTLASSNAFKVPMRTTPTLTFYNPNDTSNTNRIYNVNTAANTTITGASQFNSNLISQIGAAGTLTAAQHYFFHYVADARL